MSQTLFTDRMGLDLQVRHHFAQTSLRAAVGIKLPFAQYINRRRV